MANKAICALTYGDTHVFTLPYGECSTAAATAAKTVAVQDGKFALEKGARVLVKFTVTNTAAVANLTLNVSSTGAKSIKYRGGNISSAGNLAANRIYEFVYDGTDWELIGDFNTNTTYSVVSTSADGLAPKRDGSTTKFLRGDGTWATLPAASGTAAGITIVYPAASCTTFTSDSGTCTPAAVKKAVGMFGPSLASSIGDVKIAYSPQDSNWLKCRGQFLSGFDYPNLLAATGPVYPSTMTGTKWGDLGEYYPKKLFYINGYFVSVGTYYYSYGYTAIFYSKDFKNWNYFQLISYKYGDAIYDNGKLHIVVSGGSSNTGLRIYSSSTPWDQNSYTNIVIRSTGKYTVGGIEKLNSGWMINTSLASSYGPNILVATSLDGTWSEKRIYDTAAGVTDCLPWGHCAFQDKYIAHNWNSNNIQVLSYNQTAQMISFSDITRTAGCFTHDDTLFVYCTTDSTNTVYGSNKLILKRTKDLTNWTTNVIGPYSELMPDMWSYKTDNYYIFCENAASNTRKSRLYYYNFITEELHYTEISSMSSANFLIHNNTFYSCYPSTTNSSSTAQYSLTFPLDSFQVPNITDALYWIKVK